MAVAATGPASAAPRRPGPTDAEPPAPRYEPPSNDVVGQVSTLTKRLERRYAVDVLARLEDPKREELSERLKEHGIRLVYIDDDRQQLAALRDLEQALSEYPAAMVSEFMDRVVLVNRIWMPLPRTFAWHGFDQLPRYASLAGAQSLGGRKRLIIRGLSRGRLCLVARKHIASALPHELMHLIEATRHDHPHVNRVLSAWTHNRMSQGEWREQAFSRLSEYSGPEDRATAAEFLFTASADKLGQTLSGTDARSQKLWQLIEIYREASGGRMNAEHWELRLDSRRGAQWQQLARRHGR